MKNKFFTLALCLTALVFTNCSSDDDNNTVAGPLNIIIEGAAIAPSVGGPNQQNQVYVDLSTNTTTSVQRDSWDLGFYSGTEFRVVINGSIAMAAAQLTATDIDAVTSSDQEIQDLQPMVRTNTYNEVSMQYVDDPSGDLNATAISEISATDSNNNVYLVNLGKEVGTETPATGSIDTSDDPRGWKKIRVLQDGANYILQYADLDATTHQEVTIFKNANYNYTFFSFNTNSEIVIEPAKEDWDLNFTTFTDEVFIGADSYGPYFYSDFVLSNIKEDTKVYMIDTEVETDLSYDNFTLADIDNTLFSLDQRSIGSSWRNSGGPNSSPSLKDNVFYIVSDTDGNLYKLKFLALFNEAGERGYPEFVYSLLQ
ncbi:heme-binding HmuY-like protein [Lacinutrix venerupis]|uniref:HmuY family protein n=1 Tax=Lacinutrix venerupis TaxID=1486034 RepID=UPI000EB3BC63|nr:HmuY family protein [Lacinutrix venerupis]RLJ65424.1 heme-binding HmuY-like protein [Lacinutrix venerupis]